MGIDRRDAARTGSSEPAFPPMEIRTEIEAELARFRLFVPHLEMNDTFGSSKSVSWGSSSSVFPPVGTPAVMWL